ncbi:MAG: hypothetical protein F6J93_40810, partial [Oscillatoria sp. SIO1A7]|nr:hypothetical protein [Oscillatoria sp. SIO1A7]
PVKLLTHVHRLHRHIDPQLVGQSQHRNAFTSEAKASALPPRKIIPSGKQTSINGGGVVGIATSWKRACGLSVGCRSSRRRFLSHETKVL